MPLTDTTREEIARDEPVTVTDADRAAAADILDEISSLTQDDGIGQVADLIRDGEYDEHDTVLRVARHRQAAEADTVAKVVAWLRQDFQADDAGGGDLAHWIADALTEGAHK